MGKKLGKRKREAVWASTSGKCWYCGEYLLHHDNDKADFGILEYVIDHRLPLCRGGSNDIENLAPACRLCNGRKSSKTVEEYRQYLMYFNVGLTPFTDNQVEYLRDHGITIPVLAHVTFWGEEQGKIGGE